MSRHGPYIPEWADTQDEATAYLIDQDDARQAEQDRQEDSDD